MKLRLREREQVAKRVYSMWRKEKKQRERVQSLLRGVLIGRSIEDEEDVGLNLSKTATHSH